VKNLETPPFPGPEKFHASLKATLKETMAEVIAAGQVMIPAKSSHAAELPPPSIETLFLFRRFLEDPNASFRSPEQGMAFDLVVQCITSALIVLPTGMGKSLLFIFAAWLLCQDLYNTSFVAVFVPYQSLVETRSLQMGVRTMKMSFKDADEPQHMLGLVGAPLVLISSDQGCSPSMVDFLKHAKKSNRLKCIFIDECHLLFDNFRQRLKNLAVQDEIGVPVFLNTGSLTHPDQERLLDMFGKSQRIHGGLMLIEFNRNLCSSSHSLSNGP
jgi:superfamily II DNA helicase RecQ